MFIKKLFCIIVCIVIMTSCKKDEETVILKVFSEPTYSVQPGETTGKYDVSVYMIVTEEGSNVEQQIALDAIDGFTYERGFEYLLKVKKQGDPACYSLKELLSKIKKDDLGNIVLLEVCKQFFNTNAAQVSDERLVVKEEGSDRWQSAFFTIVGFEYENDFEYLIKAYKTNVPMPEKSGMDSFTVFSFIEMISKTPVTKYDPSTFWYLIDNAPFVPVSKDDLPEVFIFLIDYIIAILDGKPPSAGDFVLIYRGEWNKRFVYLRRSFFQGSHYNVFTEDGEIFQWAYDHRDWESFYTTSKNWELIFDIERYNWQE